MIFLCDSYGEKGIGSKNLRTVFNFESSNLQILISNVSIFFTQEQYEQLIWHLHICISVQKTANRQRNEYTCFAWAGGICPRFVWAGGTFFQLCCCVSFWFWREIGFGCTYYLLCTQSTIQLCCCVSFFGYGGKQFLVLRMYLVYNTDHYYDRKKKFQSEKKVQVICLAGARSLLRPEKKFQSSVWRVRDRYYDREKKFLVVIFTQN